jgi:hypothetical protein
LTKYPNANVSGCVPEIPLSKICYVRLAHLRCDQAQSSVALAVVQIFSDLTNAGNVKRAIFTILVLAGFLQMNAQSTLFVKKGAQGNGSSWSQAFGDLQQALRIAKPGTFIWVATGVYTPTSSDDRSKSFVIGDGVVLLGGFAGVETRSDQRNWISNETILSGDIGSPSQEDNSLNVVYTCNVNNVVVDGFTICDGNSANSLDQEGSRNGTGAAWFNEASSNAHSVLIQNCTFRDNAANYAAGIYNFATNGATNNSKILNCSFTNNSSKIEGGAIMNVAVGATCNVTIDGCDFVKNFAVYGGAIFDRAKNNGTNTSQIKNNTLSQNKAVNDGSDFFTNRDNSSYNKPLYLNNVSTNAPSSSNILDEAKVTPSGTNASNAKMRSSNSSTRILQN